MVKTNRYQIGHMTVVQGIVKYLSIPAGLDQVQVFQACQLMHSRSWTCQRSALNLIRPSIYNNI